MKVSEFFANLSYGPFANLSIGMDGAGTIETAKQGKVISATNKALTQIFSRLVHKVGRVTIEMVDGVQRYELDALYAVTNTTPGNTKPRYIKDSVYDPFQARVIRILSIDDQSEECAYARILGNTTVYVDASQPGELLVVEYQMNHEPLTMPVNMNQVISVIPVLEEALEYKVASLICDSMGGEGNRNDAAMWNSKFEEVMAMVKGEALLDESLINPGSAYRDGGLS